MRQCAALAVLYMDAKLSLHLRVAYIGPQTLQRLAQFIAGFRRECRQNIIYIINLGVVDDDWL